jgi:APA family basic amino acid/polyamine antiporter
MNKYSKVLSLTDLYLFSLGNILGAGIFVLISKTTALGGSWTWLAFVIAGLMTMLSGWSYYYLSKKHLKEDGTNNMEYQVVLEKYGKNAALGVSIMSIVAGILIGSTILSGSSDYLGNIVKINPGYIKLIIIIIIAIFSCCNIKHTRIFSNITGGYEFMILVLIVIMGLFSGIGTGTDGKGTGFTDTSKFSGKGIASATFLTMFTYLGFEILPKFSKETENPEETIPKAMIYSIVTSIVIYVLVFFSAYKILGPRRLSEAKAPIAAVLGKITGNKKVLGAVALLSGVAITNGVLMTNSSNSRMLHDLGERYSIPLIKDINDDTGTPIGATLVISILVLLGSMKMDIKTTAEASNFIYFIILAIVNYMAYKKLTGSEKGDEDNRDLKRGISGAGLVTSIMMITYIITIN